MSGTLQDYFESLPFSLYPKPYIVGREFQRADNVRLRNKTLCIDDFTIIKRIGEGSYGKVYKAKDSSNKIVALKKICLEDEEEIEGFPMSSIRELKSLKQLKHKNIVQLLEIFTHNVESKKTKRAKVGKSFYMVFEYMEHDLKGLLESGLVYWQPENIAYVMRQIIEGLAFCHSKNFFHRDIKCSNILVNKRGQIKLADFGLTRLYDLEDQKQRYTNEVVTLWYRPPELLLGEEKYGPAIDVWSCGAILAELFAGEPIFKGQTELDQFELISACCGTPNTTKWPEVVKLPFWRSFKLKVDHERCLRSKFAHLPPAALDLLDDMLVLNPNCRISMARALQCKWIRNVNLMSPPLLPTYQECHEMLYHLS